MDRRELREDRIQRARALSFELMIDGYRKPFLTANLILQAILEKDGWLVDFEPCNRGIIDDRELEGWIGKLVEEGWIVILDRIAREYSKASPLPPGLAAYDASPHSTFKVGRIKLEPGLNLWPFLQQEIPVPRDLFGNGFDMKELKE